MVQFETPKALANFSPGVGAQRQPWVTDFNQELKRRSAKILKGFIIGEPFQGLILFLNGAPRVVAVLQPWAEISERLRRLLARTCGMRKNISATLRRQKLANAFGLI